jgi:dihydropteroate synthase type 2
VTARPSLLGILNITEDSFSDGGRYLAPDAAITRALELASDGAVTIDIGAASSNPNAKAVPPDVEIARMAPVVAVLKQERVAVSVDSFSVPVQRWAIAQGVDYLNDIHGFPHRELYDALAASKAKLIVMHAIQAEGPADRTRVDPATIFDRVMQFFDRRIAALEGAGIARDRLILDPGMGLFLGTAVEASYTVLRRLPALKQAFALPVLVSVSRKSFLRKLTGRPPQASGAATLSAELFAVAQGADYIRTHDPGALRDALLIQDALRGSTAPA